MAAPLVVWKAVVRAGHSVLTTVDLKAASRAFLRAVSMAVHLAVKLDV
jgi:hypothetical protein